MSTMQVALQSVELLLEATFKTPKDGGSAQFLYGSPGSPTYEHRLGETLYFSNSAMIRAGLFIRKEGPPYLRDVSMGEVRNKLTGFLTGNYGHISRDTWLQQSQSSLANLASPAAKAALAAEMVRSAIFSPTLSPTLFPLVPVKVTAAFDSEPFFLIPAQNLTAERLRRNLPRGEIVSEQFPPFADWKGVRKTPGAWLGLRAPSLSTATRMRSAILGALALLPHRMERHMFTGRAMFGGSVTVDQSWTVTFGGEAHTPALSEDVLIGAADHGWLNLVAQKLVDPAVGSRRAINSLKYYYRAWFLDEVERFPWLFMALDAMFGDQNRATQAVIDSVSPIIGAQYEHDRLRLLLGLRASVLHGGAPDIYESSKYEQYYETYGDDPIVDLGIITAAAMRHFIFHGTLVERPHTYAHLIKADTGITL